MYSKYNLCVEDIIYEYNLDNIVSKYDYSVYYSVILSIITSHYHLYFYCYKDDRCILLETYYNSIFKNFLFEWAGNIQDFIDILNRFGIRLNNRDRIHTNGMTIEREFELLDNMLKSLRDMEEYRYRVSSKYRLK
jgi:hypothetical protein